MLKQLHALETLDFCDLFDESDEILRHSYQLIYAVGECCPLPGASHRWTVAEALLMQLQTCPDLDRILKNPNITVGASSEGLRCDVSYTILVFISVLRNIGVLYILHNIGIYLVSCASVGLRSND